MNQPVLIIAEAGVNHNGDLKTAFRLIDVAAAAGADIVKFQTFKAEELVSIEAPMADYQEQNLGAKTSQLEMLKKLQLSHDDHHVLIKYAKSKGIRFLSTAFDFSSIEFLKSLNLQLWKVPSGELTNYPYLKMIAGWNERTLLSTGMADLHEIEETLQVLMGNGLERNKITILHCHTDYPTKMVDVNLRAMAMMAERFSVDIGYSDHTLGIEVPLAAVALGAKVIEKHFTLDRKMAGPDHAASLEPDELIRMVEGIRKIELALGKAEKEPTETELKNRLVARKTVVAKIKIKSGDLFSEENLTTRRAGAGVSPMLWESLIGCRAGTDYESGQKILMREIAILKKG